MKNHVFKFFLEKRCTIKKKKVAPKMKRFLAFTSLAILVFLIVVSNSFGRLRLRLWKTLEEGKSWKELEKADYCFVLGYLVKNRYGLTLHILQRLEMAEEAYRKGLCSKIVATGIDPQSQFISEWLQSKLIPQEDIIKENKSLSTRENVLFSLDLIEKIESNKQENRFLVITNSFHQLRAKLVVEKELRVRCKERNKFCGSSVEALKKEDERIPNFPHHLTGGLLDFFRELVAILYSENKGWVELESTKEIFSRLLSFFNGKKIMNG